jgi:long-chain acyl-CoA synthetase
MARPRSHGVRSRISLKSRVYDQRLANRPFLTYYDDDRQLRCTYSYAEFGTVVQRAATFLHD